MLRPEPVLAPPQPAPHASVPPDADRRRWTSGELLGAGREIEIAHGQSVYRLRLTSLGKLILTK